MKTKPSVTIRFYEELNDFLPREKKKTDYRLPLFGKQTVKDLIESQGVPHVEVDLILVNGEPVNFSYHLRAGDRISVYPEFELLDISAVNRLRPSPLREPRFVVDANLGKLARDLRMLGFDTAYDQEYDDPRIIEMAYTQKRIILTRDTGMLKHGRVERGYFVRNDDPVLQLREVIVKFSLENRIEPFTRCMACNGKILPVKKEDILHGIPEGTRKTYDEFYRCADCGRIYWKGSHYQRMAGRIRDLLNGPL